MTDGSGEVGADPDGLMRRSLLDRSDFIELITHELFEVTLDLAACTGTLRGPTESRIVGAIDRIDRVIRDLRHVVLRSGADDLQVPAPYGRTPDREGQEPSSPSRRG